MKRELTFLAGIHNAALASGDLPKTLKVLAWGETPTSYGPVHVGPATVTALQRQIADGALARIVIDFEHSSEPASPKYQPPPRKHAGYGNVKIVADDGIYLDDIQWTPSGQQFAREYADLSPTLGFDDPRTREVTLFRSLALVPNGAVKDLTFFEADQSTQEMHMDYKAALLKVLNLSADAADADIEKAMTAASGDTETFAVRLADSGRLLERFSGELATLRAQQVESAKTIEALSAGLTRRDKDAVLDRAAAQGKIVMLDATAIDKLTVAELQSHVDQIKATVPVRSLTPAHTPLEPAANLSIIAQYNAIDDPAKRSAFFDEHRSEIVGK